MSHLQTDPGPLPPEHLTLWLAGDVEPRASATAPATGRTDPPMSETTTVLLVEDDPHTLRALDRHLRRMGHRVHTATTGMSALEEAFRCGPDLTLALIDIRLPDMDGMELWQRINRQVMGIRGLFISGYDPRELPDLKLDRKEVLFLPKPFETSELDAAIRDLLASR